MNSLSQHIHKSAITLVNSIQKQYTENLFPKVFAGWALLTFLISFNGFLGGGLLSNDSSHVCFPHFQSCKEFFKFINLTPLPNGYSESIFFTVLFGIMVSAGYFIYQKKFIYTHILLWVLFLVKSFLIFNNYGVGNYDYYDTAIIFIFLIYPSRIDLIKLLFVILYFLASTIKIHEGWILGTYFSSLYYGLPLVPDVLIPAVTNVCIIMQLLGCWFLLSSNKKIAEYTAYFFIFFHLYSTILVGYRYPITSLLSLIVIFMVSNNDHITQNFTINKKTIVFYFFVVLLFTGQSIAYIIPGDQKLTLEGNNYGLYMFEANHQCDSYITLKGEKPTIQASYDARHRCDPYIYLKNMQKQYCKVPNTKVAWVFDHSINGEPLRRIVDTEDLCALTYLPFVHNKWIKTETEAPFVAKVYKNVYLSEGMDKKIIKKGDYIYPPFLSESEPATKTHVQLFLATYLKEIKYFYWILWIGILIYMINILIHSSLPKKRT